MNVLGQNPKKTFAKPQKNAYETLGKRLQNLKTTFAKPSQNVCKTVLAASRVWELWHLFWFSFN